MAGTRNPWEENYGSSDGQDTGGKPWEQAYQQPEAPKSRTLGAVANDTVIEVANAAAGGVSSAANFIKPGNAVSGWIDKNIVKAGEDSQSDVTKAAKQQFRDEVENADGVMGELGAVGKYVVQNPLLSAAQAAGSFVGPGLAVKAAGFAGKAAQLGAKGVERAGRAGGVAAGAAMAGGDAAGTAYELSKNAGATEDQAVDAGRQASVIPAIVGGVSGMFGAERLLAGAKGFSGGAVSRALKTGASEAAQEGLEEGVTQYEGQRAAMPYDASIDPSKGVAAAAGMGAALGGITGAGTSLLAGHGPQPGGQQPAPAPGQPPESPAPTQGTGPTLALPAPDRGVIQVAGDGTARTPAYQAPGYVGDVTDVEAKAPRAAAADFASILDTDNVYSGWSNVQDGTDRATMRDQMNYVGRTYSGKATPENAAEVAADLTQQFKWFRAASPEQRQAAISALMAPAAPIDPVREQVAAAAQQGGALSGAALTAIDTGVTQAMQPVVPEAALPAPISLEEADARDQAAYEQHWESYDADPVVSRYFEDDSDIPDFGAASNVSDEEFLRSLGATDEDIQDAIATARQPAIPQSRPAVDAGAQANEPAGPREGAGGNQAAQGQVATSTNLREGLAKIRAQKQQEAANAKAATPEAAPASAPVPAARPGAVEAAGVDRSKLLASLDQTGATREMVLDAQLKDAQYRLAQITDTTGILPADRASRLSAINQEIADLNAVRDQARELDERDRREGNTRSMLQGARQELDAAVRAGAVTPEAAQSIAAEAKKTGNAADAAEAVFTAVDSAAAGTAPDIKAITAKQIPDMTDGELQQAIAHYGPEHKRTAKLQKEVQRRAGAPSSATNEGTANVPQAAQAQQASPQPAQAGAAPATAAAPGQAGPATPAGASTVRALNDGAPAQNTGAQGTPASGAQAATEGETREQRTQRVAAAGEAWTRMRAVEREALAARAEGLNPIQRKRVPSAAWADLNSSIQRKLADAMDGRAESGGDMTAAPTAEGPISNPTFAPEIAQQAQAATENVATDAEQSPAQETTHNGTRIYPTKIKMGDEVKFMWAVESPDNQRRRAAGERTIGGDSLHETIEQAKAAAEREAKRDAEQQAAKAEQDAADKARRDAEEARKAANRPKSVVERRKDAILDGPSKIGQGTKRAVITTAVDNGYAIEAKMVYDHAAKKRDQEAVDRASRAGYILGVSNENLPLVKAGNEAKARLKEGKYEKPEYRVYQGSDTKAPFREITKTEYDYAQELKAQRAAAPQAEAAQPTTPQQADNEFLPEGWTKSVNGFTKRPVYRMEQGVGQPFAVVTQTDGMTYEVQIRHGDKQLTTGTQRGALSEVLAAAEAELGRMTQADSVTHADPGEKAEAATPSVVTDSLKKAARNEDTKPSEMRKWLVAEIDKELLQAPDRADYDEAVKRLGEKDAISGYTGNGPFGKNNETGYITFDVPGDGKYKVRNSVRGLLEFRKNVMASQGFKDSGQKRVKPEQNDGVQGGSGSNMAAITNMVEEGDFEAARDYAEAVGIKLEDVKVPRGENAPAWKMFLSTGKVPEQKPVSREWTITNEQNPNGTWSRVAKLKRTADGAEYEATVTGTLDNTRATYVLTKDGKEYSRLTSGQPFGTAIELAENAMPAANDKPAPSKASDTGWNMAGTGYGGKRYIGRNITLDDGREVVARVYENAGNYDEVEIKVDGARKFTVRDSFNAQDKADAFIKTLTSKDGDASAPVAEPPAPAGRTYLAVPFNEKDYAKRAGAKWDEGKKLWYADPVGGDGAAAGEININLKQYVPQDSTKDDRYNYYGDKALATAVALNASARDGVQYDTIKRKHPDGMMMWSVVKAGEQTQAAGSAKSPTRVTPQISGNPEKFIKVAADSVRELRSVDVDRVLTETPVQFRAEVASYIRDQRKDLADEVDDVMADIQPKAAAPAPAPSIPAGYKPAGEPFYRDGKQIQGYAPFAPGERVTMKESAGQSGVVESLASPDDAGVFASAVVKFDNGSTQIVKFDKLDAEMQGEAAAPAPAPSIPAGPRREPAKVSLFAPYEDGDIVTINGQDWTVKQDTPGWYLTTTGNWRGQHPTIRNVKAMADLIRAVEQAAVAQPAKAQPEAPKLTPAEAKSLMAWEDLGQKDGVKTHALTFYESQADKDAKRGRMIVAKVTKGDRSANNWMVEGDDKPLAVLGMAKKRAEEIGMAKAVADGFVEATAAKLAAAKPAAAPQPEAPAAPITDFGEKIGGARKDVWSGFKDDLNKVLDDDIAGQPLTKVWPAPDYQKLIDAGMNAKTVAAVRALRDEVPAKPRAAWKVKRWAEQVKTLRGLANDVMDGKITVQDMERMGANKGTSLRGMMGRIELYELVGHEKSLEGVRFAHHHYALYKGRENVSLWVVEKDAGATAFSNWPREIATGDTKEQALAAFKEKYAGLDLEKAVRKAAFDIFSERGSNAFFVGKKIGRNYARLEGPFNTVKEAREYREKNLAALEAKLEKYKEIPRERADVNQPRVGVDMRNGQDVTPQMFGEVFGFRGVEFGNWVEQKRRQKDLNDAFDALMDMAAVLDIPPKAISLNGQLGLAFGARGSGGVHPAAAHYEPDNVVINLTKKEGAGSLGHEWWHALDNYFAKQRKVNRGSFMTTGTDVGLAARGKDYYYEGGIRQEMIDAFGAVVKAINLTAMKARASTLDGKRTKDYWTTGEEMSARAFESYLISKLQDQNASNDYLANVVSEETWDAMAVLGMENENSYPYPTAAEIPAIRAGFDHFFQTVETKEDDAGNVALYSSADATLPAKPLSLNRVNQLVQEALSGIRGAPPVEVTARPADVGLQVPAGSVGYGVTLRSGDIYVFQSAMGSDLDVFKTVFHELFHRGVRVLVPKGKYVQTMLDLAKGDSRIQQLAIEWKNTEMGQKQKDNLRKQGYTGSELTGQYEALAIEEALAAVAEEIKAEGRLGSKPKNMTIRFLANWLAKLADLAGMKKLAQGIRNMSYNEAERFVMSAIDRSGEPVQAGRTDNLSAKQAAQAGDQTQTEAFKRWFGDSKVVDADGKPLVVYHGTAADFSAFDTSKGKPGVAEGAWFSSEQPSRYANGDGARVMPAYLSIKNPKVMDFANRGYDKAQLEAEGYDGVIDIGRSGRPYTVVAFRPEQVKSAIGNNGNFDPANADIRFRSADLASRAGMADLASKARDELNKTFGAPGKLSWWHKTVGTMFNLAERSPEFKRVFDSAQGFVDDVSYYATDAAELAPRLLPKLETWRDIAKRPITAADNAAVAKPVFEGTLDWARDESGKPVRLQTLLDAAEKLTPQQKAQRLLRNNKISEGMLKAWQGLPLDQYEKLVASRYESQMLQAGVVWTPAELKSLFKLTDAQVELYQEFRAATDRSLDTMARADMLRYGGKDVAALRDMVMDAKDVQDAAQILRDHLQMLAKENPDRAGEISQLSSGMLDRAARVQELQEQGYAPLSRFGQYTVDVVDANGERQYFGLFETAREANVMAIKMRKEFGQDAVTQGTLSNDEFKLLAGITPESLELFGNMLGLESDGDQAKDQAFQEYLRRTKTNRSAMRRLIHRQGIAGYSEDVGRVLASFIYSNSRQTSAGLHMGELGEAITAIPKQQGELKDAAIQLSEYVKNPQEEAQAVRGLLFAMYLGGSVASAFVNMSQPAAVTFPWLSQFGGAKQAAAELGRAAKNLANRGHRYEADLAAALKHAEEEGTVSPQEVHQLMAQARGSGSLRPGDGTRVGDARAAAGNALTRLSLAWGKVFGAAEQVNRRMTFIAAYRVAKAQGMANPAAFAKKAVIETQFTYSKANKMKWGRGAVGATAMTFKTYSIAYLELLGRMWTQGGPEGKKAVLLALGMLMLMGGAGGLPFAEDAEDLVDGLAQLAGYNFNSKKAKQELLESLFGEAGAGFIERGITGLPGMPLDVSGRLGMGNLLPATGLFKEKTDYTRDVLEVVGPVGDLAKRVASGTRSILAGDVGAGLLQMAPAAARNWAKGADMAATGMYRDDKGYKVLDTSAAEAAMKFIGFQPASVSKVQEANFINQQAKNFYNMQAQEIRAKWAKGIFEKDPALVAEARADLEAWNRKNPDQRIVVSMPAVLKRVREMGKTKDQRIADTAPKAMRQQLREEAAKARATL